MSLSSEFQNNVSLFTHYSSYTGIIWNNWKHVLLKCARLLKAKDEQQAFTILVCVNFSLFNIFRYRFNNIRTMSFSLFNKKVLRIQEEQVVLSSEACGNSCDACIRRPTDKQEHLHLWIWQILLSEVTHGVFKLSNVCASDMMPLS